MNDPEWQQLVRNIANSSVKDRVQIEKAEVYLWAKKNWERLSETAHGRFLREVVSEVPDLWLKGRYLEEVLRYPFPEPVPEPTEDTQWP